MNKKRICIIRRKAYPWQRNVRRNAEALSKAGYEVDVLCLKWAQKEPDYERLNGVNVYRSNISHHRSDLPFIYIYDYAAFFLLTFIKLTRLSFKKRYDLIEVDTMPDFLVFITFLAKMRGSKIILYMFENMPLLYMSSFHKSEKHIVTRVLHLMEKWSAIYADRVVVSDGMHYKRTLESRGIPGEKIIVVLNVPDDAIFSKQVEVAKPDNNFRLIISTTVLKRYGIQTAIKAIPLIKEHIPELTLDILGVGEYLPELERLVQKLGVDNHVNFLGEIIYDEVPRYISRSDIGLAPMCDDVGLPNKLFEYFALNIPAVVSAQPSLIEAFGNDSCVSFFQPNNEKDLAERILEIYQNPQKRDSMIANARKFYNNCQWSTMKQRYLKVYRELLEK